VRGFPNIAVLPDRPPNGRRVSGERVRAKRAARVRWTRMLGGSDAADSGYQARCLPSRLIPHRHRPRAELQPAHELQVDTLR